MKQPPQSDPRRDISREDWYSELERLAQRHELGELTDDEFAREKQRILKGSHRQKTVPERLDVIAVTYNDEFEARSAYDHLNQLHKEGTARIVDAAVLAKETSGKVRILEYGQLTPGAGASGRRVAVIGALARVIFPPSMVVSLGIESTRGAVVDITSDREFDNRELRTLGDSVRPGQSAIVAVVQAQSTSKLARHLRGCTSFTTHTLHSDIASVVLIEQEEDSGSNEK